MKVLITDNDSTLMKEEILDEIAKYAGNEIFEKIQEITDQKMNGELDISFQESLEKRVEILVSAHKKITHKELQYVSSHKMSFSEGVDECIQEIITTEGTLKGNFFIFSGGFQEIIHEKIRELPIATQEIEILKTQTFANIFLYNSNGGIIGVDWEKSHMIAEDAKLRMTKKLIEANVISDDKSIIGLGDGSNDIGMIPDSRGFSVAYIGSVYRKNTVEQANGKIAKNFTEVLEWIRE